ncbi:asparagine synthase (glutamine-hydrolyzing) [Methanospirillum sp. J.3.6.1-F.2.7.3]|uniref:Putative asparagine synthetase [glutamine-hydrolyzing] n=1 Tax=Methanospirillum purgamenti TaxID=2834276 RepID=A0A8E7B1A3_9EURY|nr:MULTISPECIES: asparagine synthase (glutamine-hydrolyzing) [Methanospirillum]MDX8548936.1 asparagine synthase (glutamine-hydrolyzing) [Methanospirillum hungatei]QVV88623.1 asparagine synthase (glutamine-hydrolyzing) [Methanospirillum sp. J.3.6.1-F.2.7.3]
MCGFTAILSLQNNPFSISLSKETGDLIKHRGPDDEGHLVFFNENYDDYKIFGGDNTPKNVIDSSLAYCPDELISIVMNNNCSLSFCHRRLSIIDLSSNGHQPMCYKDRYWIVYNGEIYNYIEIKNELATLGHTFISQSDTEVILAAYDEWGIDCQNHFIGMWAFLIFDTKNGTLFGSRDRFGIKPFYYWFSEEGLLSFASEIKAFTAIPGWKPALNGQIAYDFLIHGISDHTSETFFRGVFQLRGGEYFKHDIKKIHDSLSVKKWYDINRKEIPGQYEEIRDQYLSKLSDSILLHLRSDVPVGSCLSGGLDSSAIVSLIYYNRQNNSNNQQQTFSACSEQKQWDETEYIKEVLKGKDISAHFIIPSVEDLFSTLKQLLWHQDEPFGSTSIYAQWLVFQSAKENGIKVLLDGQGADEVIGGYHYFHDIHIANLLLKRKIRELIQESIAIHKLHSRRYSDLIKSSLYFILCNNKIGKHFLIHYEKEKLSPEWLDQYKLKSNQSLPLLLPEYGKENDLFTRYCYHQTFYTSLPNLLHYEDRNSMAHSLESRVPYLDNRFVEYIINLPEKYKIHRAITKYIMRLALNSILPDRIRCRMDKMGFITPEEYWIKVACPGIFQLSLEKSITNSKGIIKPEAMNYFKKMVSGQIPFSNTIWRMIIFGLWMDLFRVELE